MTAIPGADFVATKRDIYVGGLLSVYVSEHKRLIEGEILAINETGGEIFFTWNPGATDLSTVGNHEAQESEVPQSYTLPLGTKFEVMGTDVLSVEIENDTVILYAKGYQFL